MRRLFFLFFVILILFLGCAKKETELIFAVGGAPNEVDYWETLIDEFNLTQQRKVRVLRQPTDTDQRRQSLVIPLKAKKSDPDVFLMDVAWVGQFAASNWLMPLNSYIEKDNFDMTKIFSAVVKQADSYEGQIIALPVYVDCGLLYYRKDLLEKYGFPIPEKWDELVEYSTKIQQEERKNNPQFYGFVWQGAQYEGLICNFLEFISSNNGLIIDKEGKIALDTNENIQALNFMSDLINKYKISPPNTFTEMKEEEVRTFFENGNALFERNWPYAWGLHTSDESSIKGKVGMAVLPKFENGRNAATLGGWHIGVSNFSDNKNESWELVKFILSYDTQKKVALKLGWNPGRKDIYDDKDVQEKMPQMEVLKKAFEYSVARPNLPAYTQVSEILQRYVNGAISGKMDAEQALNQAQKEIENIIRTYRE